MTRMQQSFLIRSGGSIAEVVGDAEQVPEKLKEMRDAWTRQIAITLWKNEGEPTDRAHEHWHRAEGLLNSRLAALMLQHFEWLNEEQCGELAALPVAQALSRFRKGSNFAAMVGRHPTLRLHTPPQGTDEPCDSDDASMEATVDMNYMNSTVRLEKTSESTPEQKASAARNRDVLSLVSAEDRERYSQQFAVVVRSGSQAGQVLGAGTTREEAVRIAQQQPNYRPFDCAVAFFENRTAG